MTWKRISTALSAGKKRRLRAVSFPIAAAALIAGLMVASGCASPVPHAATDAAQASPSCTAGTTVQTKDGPVCGLTASGITSYLDIPYAAPPVGDLRWEPPQPHASWTSVMQATTSAPECPSPGAPGSQPPTGTSEDCLYLKVEVPAGVKPGENLPVMYEVHGGGFLGTALTNDGDNLVNSGKAVYVFANYRLGILGFLADKALGAHSGDYGLQDQQAGLRWVQQNIASFGGDPGNVTVFGESAGGASTCDQVASPTAKGLFEKAISVSGFYNYQDNIVWSKADCKSTYFTESQAQTAGAQFAAKVGCGNVTDVAACLRNVPAATLVEDGGQYTEPTAGGTIGPIVNGTTLTMSPATAFAAGHVNHVTLISDVGRDEFNGGVYTNTSGLPVVVADTAAQYQQLVHEQFGSLAPAVERLYPLSQYQSPYTDYRTIMADSASVCPMLKDNQELARYIPVYVDINADADNPAGEDLQLPLGAQHSGTNGLVHYSPSELDPNQAALQDQLLAEWSDFAHTGNPSASGTPSWALYSGSQHPVMLLQPGDTSESMPAAFIAEQHNCGFWDQVTHY